jgi:amidase
MRRGLLAVAALCCVGPAARGDRLAAPFAYEEATAAALQARMAAGLLTSRALTEAYLARIRAIDPLLQSVLEVNPDALAIADGLDQERKQKGPRGPLHGIPVLIKDNIATGDKQMTTAGSLALLGVRAKQDAFVAERLRAAGAVILGKTNLSEWANIRSTHSSSGWSGRGGQTRNPYALDRTPCGSSSGTGAAIAASLAAIGVGTETDGSIVCPSTSQSLVGIKPTVGLVSRAGIIPISHTQDTAGPMARTVADAALLLTALAGPDKADPATASQPAKVDYTKFAAPGRLDGVRLGVPRAKVFGQSPGSDRIAEEALARLRALGAELVDPADIPHLGEYDDAETAVLQHELKADLPQWLAGYAPQAEIHSLEEAIAWNRAHAAVELQLFGQEFFEQAQQKGPLTSAAYLKALADCRRLARDEGLLAVLAEKRLDALVAPTGGAPWVIDLVTGDHFAMSSSSPAAVAGTPAITVPAGFDHGLPVGITFMGAPWSEGKLVRIAAAFEEATHARRPPRLEATVDLDR